jgi:hypothetical protein
MHPESDILQEAVKDLRSTDYYDLPYRWQIRLYTALATPVPETENARKRRVFLDTIAIRYVLNRVEYRPTSEYSPQAMLEYVTDYLDGDTETDVGVALWRDCNHYYERELLPNDTPGLFLYLACLKVVYFVIDNRPAAPSKALQAGTASIQNNELEPDDWSASYTASAAYSPNLERDTDRRREFWEWWLLTAVPLARSTFS